MADLLRNLRGSAKPILLVAAGFTIGGLYPILRGEEANGVLLILAALLFIFAAAVLCRKRAPR